MIDKLDAVIWPDRAWPEPRREWAHAERIGLGRGWLWDHLTLGGRPVWHEAYAALGADRLAVLWPRGDDAPRRLAVLQEAAG